MRLLPSSLPTLVAAAAERAAGLPNLRGADHRTNIVELWRNAAPPAPARILSK